MATAANMGGLYATVRLDTSQALAEIRKLNTEFKRAFAATGGTRGGLGAVNTQANKASASLNKTQKAAKGVKTEIDKTGRAADKAGKKLGNMGKALEQGATNFTTTLSSLGAARSGNYLYAAAGVVNGLKGAFTGAATSGLALGVAVAGITAAVVIAVGTMVGWISVIKRLSTEAVKSATSLETLMVSFEALLGSRAAAEAEFGFLVEAARVSPFFTDAIVNLDRFLLAQGLLNTELRQNTVKALIDFGSAAGLTGADLQNLARALGQVYVAGRLTGDEARQLRNNFLGVDRILRELPQYANESGIAIKKATEEGLVSARDFYEGFFAYTADFKDAAAQQQQTLAGLRDTIIDTFQLGLGEATLRLSELDEGFSVLGALKAPLRELLDVINSIDFTPLAASLGAVVSVFTGPFTNFITNSGAAIVKFFQESLPSAIAFTATVLNYLWTITRYVFSLIIQGVANLFRPFGVFSRNIATWQDFVTTAIKAVGYVIIGLSAVWSASFAIIAGTTALLSGLIAAGIIIILKSVVALIRLLSGNAGGAWDTFTDGLNRGWEAIKDGAETARGIATDTAAGIAEAWNAIGDLEPIELPEFEVPETGGAGLPGEDAFPGGSSGDDAGGGGGSAAADAANRAMDTLFDLTKRWFDQRSELEKAFLGSEGFEATASQIAAGGKKLIEALTAIGGPEAEAAIAVVDSGTRQLLQLAAQREAVAEQLADAEKELDDLIKERDRLSDSIADSARKFALSLRTEEETVKRLESFSERGFFYETESTRQKSFLESLRERYAALLEFQTNLKKLAALGFSNDVISELAAAGPDAAGAAASELAAAGPEVVDEVNTTFQGIADVAENLGSSVADTVYGGAIDAAQAVADGLTADLAAIEEAAIAITNTIYEAVLPLAKEMEEVGKAAGGGMADGISGANPEVEGAIAGTESIFGDGLDRITAGVGEFGIETIDSLGGTADSMLGLFEGLFADILTAWYEFRTELGNRVAAVRGFLAEAWGRVKSNPFVNAVANWYNSYVKGPWALLWDTFRYAGEYGIVNAGKALAERIFGWNLGVVDLPLSASARSFLTSLSKAVNWIIDQFNRIPWLPDLPRWNPNLSGAGGGKSTGTVPKTVAPPSSAGAVSLSNTGYSNPEVHVYIGNEEIDGHIDTVVRQNNSSAGTNVFSGSRL